MAGDHQTCDAANCTGDGSWAEHGADRQVVPYTVATDMDLPNPNPDSGEEYYHTNTQLYGVLDDHNPVQTRRDGHGAVECAALGSWVAPTAHPVPEWTADPEVIGQALSSLGKGLVPAFIAMARQLGVPLPAELNDPEAALPPGRVVGVLRDIAGHFFPLLAGDAKDRR